MKIGVKSWILLGYGLLLLASFLYRKASSGKPQDLEPGWSSVDLPVFDSGQLIPDKTISMKYREMGDPEGPVLLFLHGSPMASGCFDKLVPSFEKEYRLILPDLPGFGHSRVGTFPDLSIEAHARYIDAFLNEKDLSDVSVVAYSLGAGVALHLADMEPGRINNAVMLSAIGVQDRELLGDYLLNHVLHGLQLTVVTGIQELIPHFGWIDRAMINRNYARNFFETDQRPLRELLNQWEKPMAIIHGDHDRLVSPAAAREHFRIVPQSSLSWIENGSHIALMRRAEEVAAIIRREVRRTDSQERSNASAERIAAGKLPSEPVKLDGTPQGRLGVMSLLGVATFASEDLSCISGGLLASRQVVSFGTTVAGCLIGIFIGDMLLFLLGRWCGSHLQKIPLVSSRIDGALVESGREWVEAHAAKLIVASRFLPGSRLPTYCSMGATGMPLRKFTGWFLLAVTIWTPLLVGLSMLFGERLLPFFEENERYLFPGFLGVLILGMVLVRLASSLVTWKGRRLVVSRWRRIVRWEFWPTWLIYSLLVPTLIRLTFRYRSFTVFTAANPGIDCGGLAVEPKLLSLTALQKSGNVPPFRAVSSVEELDEFLAGENLNYPMVLKPNEGEKGRGVAIVMSRDEAETYLSSIPREVEIVAQDYVEGKEFGVFYYRYPHEKKGEIFSITEKKYLYLSGDGEHSLEELILRDERAVCMAPFFLKLHRHHLWDVPAKGEQVALAKLGTHCRGAVFVDGDRFQTEALTTEIDRISQHFNDFYFGRYDVKVPSPEALARGERIAILELNGVTSEATAMYDPKNSLWAGLKTLRKQWELAYEIGAANREKGIQPASLRDIFRNLKQYRTQDKFEAPLL